MLFHLTRCIIAIVIFVFVSIPTFAKDKDTLVIGMTQYPASFHPNFESMLAKYFALNLTMRPITTYDADWELVCLLCTELPTIENEGAVLTDLGNGKQGIAVTYSLQPDARWGDGTPVTTKDVAYTIEVGKNPESAVLGAEFYRRILSVEAIDDKTFTLYLDRVEFNYNELPLYLIPEHIDRPNFSEPSDYRTRNAYDNDSLLPGLYFGPYRISKIEPGAYIEFVKNTTWWGKDPHFKKIVLRIIENTAALEANLLSGSIDYISGLLGVTIDQAINIQSRHPDDYNYIFRSGLIYEHIDLNLDNPIFADHRVRKALLHAADRQLISEQFFGGHQPVADGFIVPLNTYYNPNLPKYEYDPELAIQLLEAAGWTEINDGVRHNIQGEPLRLEFGTTAGSRIRESIQQILQSQWSEVGIEVVIQNQPARVFFGETVAKRLFSGLAMYAWVNDPNASPRTTLHSTEIPEESNNWVGSNYPGYRNDEMDTLIDAVEITLNEKERDQIWAKIQHRYSEDLPALPLYYRASPYIIPKWLKGIEPTGNSSTTTLWVENWYATN